MTRDPLNPPYGTTDPAGMAARIEAIPRDIERALADGDAQPWKLPGVAPDLVAFGGMGGSAMAGMLCATLHADRLPRPMAIVGDYRWPACVTGAGFAVLSSYSGNTEETLALYREARRLGVARAAITSGGELASLALEDRIPLARLPGGSPPRAALFHGWVATTRLLHALGWLDDPAHGWREAARTLEAARGRIGIETPEAANSAKQAASALEGRMCFVYSGGTMSAVATRIRTQINENAKLLGHSAVVPELNHNEIVGWERRGPLTERAAVVIVRDPEDPEPIARRLTLTAEMAAERGAVVVEAVAPRGGTLARAAALVQWGDYVSLYLALLAGVDPTPVQAIDAFKRRLAER